MSRRVSQAVMHEPGSVSEWIRDQRATGRAGHLIRRSTQLPRSSHKPRTVPKFRCVVLPSGDTAINQYVLLRYLGHGSSSSAYLALDAASLELVTLKISRSTQQRGSSLRVAWRRIRVRLSGYSPAASPRRRNEGSQSDLEAAAASAGDDDLEHGLLPAGASPAPAALPPSSELQPPVFIRPPLAPMPSSPSVGARFLAPSPAPPAFEELSSASPAPTGGAFAPSPSPPQPLPASPVPASLARRHELPSIARIRTSSSDASRREEARGSPHASLSAPLDDPASALRCELAAARVVGPSPRLIGVRELVDDDLAPRAVLVLEYMAGGPVLSDAGLAMGLRIPPPVARRHVQAAAEGLSMLHAAGLSHGDVKPENVLLGPGRSCVLADLGSATRERRMLSRGALPAGLAGSPAFLAPEAAASAVEALRRRAARERASGDGDTPLASSPMSLPDAAAREAGQRVPRPLPVPTSSVYERVGALDGGSSNAARARDVYALGVTLFAIIYGRLPHVAKTPEALLAAAGSEPLLFPEAPRGGLPPGLRVLLARMLQRDPERRIQMEGVMRDPWLTGGEDDERAQSLDHLLEAPEAELVQLAPGEELELGASVFVLLDGSLNALLAFPEDRADAAGRTSSASAEPPAAASRSQVDELRLGAARARGILSRQHALRSDGRRRVSVLRSGDVVGEDDALAGPKGARAGRAGKAGPSSDGTAGAAAESSFSGTAENAEPSLSVPMGGMQEVLPALTRRVGKRPRSARTFEAGRSGALLASVPLSVAHKFLRRRPLAKQDLAEISWRRRSEDERLGGMLKLIDMAGRLAYRA